MAMRSRVRSLLASSAVIGVSAFGSAFLPTAASAATCSGTADEVSSAFRRTWKSAPHRPVLSRMGPQAPVHKYHEGNKLWIQI